MRARTHKWLTSAEITFGLMPLPAVIMLHSGQRTNQAGEANRGELLEGLVQFWRQKVAQAEATCSDGAKSIKATQKRCWAAADRSRRVR